MVHEDQELMDDQEEGNYVAVVVLMFPQEESDFGATEAVVHRLKGRCAMSLT